MHGKGLNSIYVKIMVVVDGIFMKIMVVVKILNTNFDGDEGGG